MLLVSVPRWGWGGGVRQHRQRWCAVSRVYSSWCRFHHPEGECPFAAAQMRYLWRVQTEQRIQWNITGYTNQLKMCLQLLKKNPLKRLGAGEKDANEVKGDKFFEVKAFSHKPSINENYTECTWMANLCIFIKKYWVLDGSCGYYTD